MAQTVLILEVQNVKLTVYKTEPATLHILAEGVVPTPGYKNPTLAPYVYIQFPPDGIWDFSFMADQPDGIVQQVLQPICATYIWEGYPEKLKGVRVHSSTNSVEALIGEYAPKTVSLLKQKSVATN